MKKNLIPELRLVADLLIDISAVNYPEDVELDSWLTLAQNGVYKAIKHLEKKNAK